MLYPLLKTFLKKIGATLGLTLNGGSGRAISTGPAYRLESYPKHRTTRNKGQNQIPENTRYGSAERIVSSDGGIREAASGGDSATVPYQPNNGYFSSDGGQELARVTVCSGPSRSDARHPSHMNDSNAGGITVTREYNVSGARHINGMDQNAHVFLDV
jgi:hypothetical protein